jgi:hypothetical protein
MNIELAREYALSTSPSEAIPALGILSDSGSLTDLQSVLSQIKNRNHLVQRAAIEAATELIKHNLIEHFNELPKELRSRLSALLESLDPSIIEDIGKDVYCEDNDRRLRAVQILGLLSKNPKVREILAGLVKDRNEKIRATAVNLIGKLIGPENQHVILSLLNDPDKRVRANTVEAIESLGNKRLLPILLRFRKDPVNRIRANVLKAMYNLGNKEIMPDIMLMLQNEDPFMQASGLWLVAQINFHNLQIESLTGFLMVSDNEMVTRNAAKALKTINTTRALGFIRYLTPPEKELT